LKQWRSRISSLLEYSLTVPLTQGDAIATMMAIDAAASVAEMDALGSKTGPARDSQVYAGAIMLIQAGRSRSLVDAADMVRKAINSGETSSRFKAATG
jgi:anthranilate phosphoribosyltransferase